VTRTRASHPEFVWLWLALAILASVAAFAYARIGAAVDTFGWVEHTNQVLQRLEEVNSLYARASSARRVYAVAGDESQLRDVPDLDGQLDRAIDLERGLLADNPGQVKRLDALVMLVSQRLAALDSEVAQRRRDGTSVETGEQLSLTKRIREIREAIAAEENRLLADRNARTRRDIATIKVAEVVGTLVSTIILLLAFGRLREEIAGRKRSEQAIKAAKDSAEAANKELETFSYSVAHDLRAPLRAIDGFSQALQEDSAAVLDEEGRGHLARVRAATGQMAQLIDGLLGLSRLTRAELAREKVDLTSLARQAVARFREAEPGRRVEVVVQEGLAAEGDPRLLAAVFENLLGNAWKFTKKSASARIEVGRMEDGGETFFVRDNGAGFDQAYVHKLFGAFQRLHGADEFEGSGIGLATVQRIVRRHGGKIWAEGEVDRGATFFFTL
jgi:signal transduction histidine kinase